MPQRFEAFVENSRWVHNGVHFLSLHIVGSNNFEARPGAPQEFFARDAANQAWLEAGFARAGQEDAPGIVVAFQADMWEDRAPREPLQNGQTTTLATVRRRAAGFGQPVLLVHGDGHVPRIDQPLRDNAGRRIDSVTRLMVMGAREVHAVRVTVDPAKPGLFAFIPVRVPGNAQRPRM
jgi:hypothetical protein